MTVKPVVLSAADKEKKEDAMPFPPKDDADDKPKDAAAVDPDISETPESAEPPPDDATTALAGASTPGDNPDKTDDGQADEKDADAAQAMMELEHHLSDMGIEFHGSAHDTLLNFVQHLNTAIATHKATKEGSHAEPDGDENLNEQDQTNQQQTNPNNPQEPEVAESAPIMMSATTTPTKPTPREIALAKKLVKSSNDNLRARIANLYQGGYIDDGIKKELLDELGSIKLSMSDLTDSGDLKPTTVSIRVEAYERIARTKKPGTFAKPRDVAKPHAKPNPLKPISSSVALSAGEDEVIVEPSEDDPNEDAPRPLNEEVVDRLSGGRYRAYKEKMNGAAQ